jgi:hypothetical protein
MGITMLYACWGGLSETQRRCPLNHINHRPPEPYTIRTVTTREGGDPIPVRMSGRRNCVQVDG